MFNISVTETSQSLTWVVKDTHSLNSMIYFNVVIRVSEISVICCTVSKRLACHLAVWSTCKRYYDSDDNLKKQNLLSVSKKSLNDNKKKSSSSNSKGAYKNVSMTLWEKRMIAAKVMIQK